MRLYAGSNPAGGSNSALPSTFHAYEHNAYAYHGGCKYADAGAALRGRGRFDSGNRRQAVIRVMGKASTARQAGEGHTSIDSTVSVRALPGVFL